MKTFKDIQQLTEKYQPDPPALLILRRKFIRMISPDIKVGVYQSNYLNKLVTIPYSDIQFSAEQVTEETKPVKKKETKPVEKQDNLAIIKNIVASSTPDDICFVDGTDLTIEVDEANMLLACYTRLTPENKKKFEDMLQKGEKKVASLIQFCHKSQ